MLLIVDWVGGVAVKYWLRLLGLMAGGLTLIAAACSDASTERHPRQLDEGEKALIIQSLQSSLGNASQVNFEWLDYNEGPIYCGKVSIVDGLKRTDGLIYYSASIVRLASNRIETVSEGPLLIGATFDERSRIFQNQLCEEATKPRQK